MAGQVYFGRAGLPTASGGDGLALYRGEWGGEGDDATVELVIRGQSSDDDAKALRDQVAGYNLNTDEPVIPVVDNSDTTRSGFYRVQRIRQEPELTGREGSGAANIAYRLTAELLRVPGWQAPMFEIVSVGAHRGGGGVATGDPWIAFPQSPSLFSWRMGTSAAGSSGLISTETGDIVVATEATSDYLYDGNLSYYVAPENYYKGASGIQVTYDGGTTWRTLVGRQMPNDVDGWRLTNFKARCLYTGDATDIQLRAGYYDNGAAAWETTDFNVAGAVALGTPAVVSVLRNAPECSAVSLCAGTTHTARADVELTLRRGGTLIEGVISGASANYSIARTASENGASITGGIEAAAANASGNKYILLSPDTITKDISGVSGISLTSAATSFRFAFGVNNSDLLSGVVTVQEQYFAANDIRQKIAAR